MAQAPQTDARFAFFAGKLNRCFLADSQTKTFDYFNHYRKDFHSLYILREYSIRILFIGENAWKDIFPLILQELDKLN